MRTRLGTAQGGAVRLTGVTKHFDTRQGPLAALDGVSLEISAGEFVAVVGPSSDEVLDIVVEWTGLEPETLRGTRSHHLPVDLSVDFQDIATIQQFYLDQGTLAYDQPVDDRELWDLRWRDAALSDG